MTSSFRAGALSGDPCQPTGATFTTPSANLRNALERMTAREVTGDEKAEWLAQTRHHHDPADNTEPPLNPSTPGLGEVAPR
ncbi:hypothetical protein GCM10022226_45600 [Sphaerisporangium flaviroseum]|uniref:Uncharacterized protein n=1 Tax=Sphaerisporangium flaviroseum TaxID=509199 RepID=A0ABP7IJQ6_9ACTN